MPMNKAPITNVVLMEPQPLVCLSLRNLLKRSDLKIVGILKSYQALKTILELHKVDVIVMELYDERCNPLDGLNFIKNNARALMGKRLVIITHVDCGFLIKALTNEKPLVIASKQDNLSEIINAFNHGLAGKSFFSLPIREIKNNANIKALSPAEMRVYALLVKHYSPMTIAKELGKSYKTIQATKVNIMKKIGVDNYPALLKMMNKYQTI